MLRDWRVGEKQSQLCNWGEQVPALIYWKLFYSANSYSCHKLRVIQLFLCNFNSSLLWNYISSHVHILEFCTLFYSQRIHWHQFALKYRWSTLNIHIRSAPRPNDYPGTTTQFLDSCAKFSFQITRRVFPPQWRNNFLTTPRDIDAFVWRLNEWKIHGQKAGTAEHFSKHGDRGTD